MLKSTSERCILLLLMANNFKSDQSCAILLQERERESHCKRQKKVAVTETAICSKKKWYENITGLGYLFFSLKIPFQTNLINWYEKFFDFKLIAIFKFPFTCDFWVIPYEELAYGEIFHLAFLKSG